MKYEYPQLGARFKVFHHTQVLAELLRKGKITMKQGGNIRVVYHDPCYLGRYHQIFNEPRFLLRNVPGATVIEMKRTRERSFCCGAGGGCLWREEIESSEHMSSQRAEEALQAGATAIVTACPFCLAMLADTPQVATIGNLEVVDIVEVVERAF
jgi:Fe-S oxidoreductase